MGAGLTLGAVRKDGSEFAVEISLSPLDGDADTAVIAVVRDITQRADAEAELRHTRDQLAEAQRVARVGSWEWDIPANVVTWSDEMFRIYGLEPGSEVPSYEGFLERVHPTTGSRSTRATARRSPTTNRSTT